MPALDILHNLDAAARDAHARVRQITASHSAKLPSVRVFGKLSADRFEESLDVLRDGILKRKHKSSATTDQERALEQPECLYFHLGRTHPDYGNAALVLKNAAATVRVTPFGLGGLLCPGKGGHHDSLKCISPIAHEPIPTQVNFVRLSTWDVNWRERLADYLALYFDNIDAYFAAGAVGKPTRHDPDGIFASDRTVDWRAWTCELRVATDVRVGTDIPINEIVFWGIEESFENHIDQLVQDSGTPKDVLFPFLTQLPRERRIVAEPGRTVLETIDQAIVEYVR